MEIEKIKKRFANHKAIFTDYGNIKILDFKNPDSFEYRIRFLFEEDYCRVHKQGGCADVLKPLSRPPQSWCYVEEVSCA